MDLPAPLKDLAQRLAAGAVVFGIFVGLGTAARVNLFGLGQILGDRSAFFGMAFLLISVVAVGWIAVQRTRRC